MKISIFLLALASFCFGQQTPAEVPVENEPHHHLVFENEYVRVFKVEVAPHEATLVHRHKRDYVVVTIGDAEVTNAVVGKEAKKWSFKDGDVTFLEATGEKSFAHKAVNESDRPFVNYTIETKRSAPTVTPVPLTSECVGAACIQVVLGTHNVKCERMSGGTFGTTRDVKPHLFITLTEGGIWRSVSSNAEPLQLLKRGDWVWAEPGDQRAIGSKAHFEAISCEFP